MLGFGKPFLRDKDGADYYSECFDSAWSSSALSSSSSSSALSSLSSYSTSSSFSDSINSNGYRGYPRPFARPNLYPDTFFYLIIDNLDLGNDAIYACNPDLTINNIFAKIQVIPCCDQSNQSNQSNVIGSTNLGSSFTGSRNDYLYNTQVSSNKVYLESPLRILDRMDIRFVDAFGDPVDFGRLEHSLTFRIVQYIDYLVDTNFDSTRGI
jgi:hypothetical protein